MNLALVVLLTEHIILMNKDFFSIRLDIQYHQHILPSSQASCNLSSELGSSELLK